MPGITEYLILGAILFALGLVGFLSRRNLIVIFLSTELNLISSSDLSGMHPLAPDSPGKPSQPIRFPNTFFLNANLLAGGGPTGYVGLGIQESKEFGSLSKVTPNEYKKLVDLLQFRIAGRTGDANFAWFVPEPSHIDNSMVDRLMRRGWPRPICFSSDVTRQT